MTKVKQVCLSQHHISKKNTKQSVKKLSPQSFQKKAHVFEILTVHTTLVLKANPEHLKIPAQEDLRCFCPIH